MISASWRRDSAFWRSSVLNAGVVGSIPTAFTSQEKLKMGLPCSQCNRIIPSDDSHEIVCCDERTHLLFSKKCKDSRNHRLSPEYTYDYICEQCRKILVQTESAVELWTYAEPHYFCSRMCKNEWLQDISKNLQSNSGP